MKIDAELITALSNQVNRELYASYLYLSMSGYCDESNYTGFAHWLHAQSEEERTHAMRLVKYAASRGARLELQAIEAPPTSFGTLVEVFESILAHEEEVTAAINGVYEKALAKKDYALQVELQWFINEQVEEESTATEILDHLRRVASSPQGLFSVDRWLGRRGA